MKQVTGAKINIENNSLFLNCNTYFIETIKMKIICILKHLPIFHATFHFGRKLIMKVAFFRDNSPLKEDFIGEKDSLSQKMKYNYHKAHYFSIKQNNSN